MLVTGLVVVEDIYLAAKQGVQHYFQVFAQKAELNVLFETAVGIAI